jgi:DNA-binding NtrC family response regulator
MKEVLYLGCPLPERAEAGRLLRSASLSVVWADTAAVALSELQRRHVPVLLDLLRGSWALQIAREIRAHRADALLLAVGDARRPDLTTEAVLAGIADVFARPLSGRRVASAIEREIGYESRQADVPVGDELYHHSEAMQEVVAVVARAANMRAGVLVRGEDGTGRQVVARAIHAGWTHGAGRHQPGQFITVDCGTTDSAQLEAAIFGAPPRSAPSDAAERGLEPVSRDGRIYEARGGTLYLRNIADAPARVQARLARILRDREALLTDTGSATALDVRPVAGVDPGFDDAVRDGRVRPDLSRRLSVICIDLPPLRSRREDIPALANYFVREICASMRTPPKSLSHPALLLIAALPWRGNADELRSLLDIVIGGLAGARHIGLEDVLRHVQLDGGAVVRQGRGTLRHARARFEREYIAAVLEQHGGRISEAAKALGIQRTNLYRKIRSLRVNRGRRRVSC